MMPAATRAMMRPAMGPPPWLLPALSLLSDSVSAGLDSGPAVVRSESPKVALGPPSVVELEVRFCWKIPPW